MVFLGGGIDISQELRSHFKSTHKYFQMLLFVKWCLIIDIMGSIEY